MDRVLLNQPLLLGFTVSEVVYSACWVFSLLLVGVVCIAAYRLLRPKLPARVNCWFCNKNTLVPYNSRNCWDCPHCDQYNGFTQDGDYNIDIRKKMKDSISKGVNAEASVTETTNGLCESCNRNQELKVQQLARFKPMTEENFEIEVERFREHLDKCYSLCNDCETVLAKTLSSQKYNLLANRMNDHRKQHSGSPPKYHFKPKIQLINGRLAVCLKWVSLVFLLILSSSSAILLSEGVLRDWVPFAYLTEVSLMIAEYLDGFRRELSMSGGLIYFVSNYGNATRKSDLTTILWLLLSTFSWFDFNNLLVGLSLLTIFFHCQTLRCRTLYFSKKDLSKNVDLNYKISTENKVVKKPSLDQIVRNSLEKNADAVEIVGNDEEEPKKVRKRVQAHKVELDSNRRQTRSQSMKKDIIEKEVEGKGKERGRLYSPPPEVYNGLMNLHLTPLSTDKPEKTKNLEKKWNGLIKPAKFVPNSAVGSVAGDDSRSSTPSSACSNRTFKESDKIFDGKCTPDMSAYPYTKMSPYFSKHTPPYQYGLDFNDYNVHPSFCANGYSPQYQMFPGPMGHTTVYTYTRPTPFPFAFPHQRFSPTFDYSSPRISEVNSSAHSVSGNLFFSQQQDKWAWLKRSFYAVSVVFNIISIGVVLFSYWFGKTDVSSIYK